MAGPFSPFNLGDVYQNAQAIKGMQDNESFRKLQTQYLGQQIEQGKTEFDQTQPIVKAKLANVAAAAVFQDPSSHTQWDSVMKMVDPTWQPAPDGTPPEQIRAGAKQVLDSTTAALTAYHTAGVPQFGATYNDKSGAVLQKGPNGEVRQVVAPDRSQVPSGYQADPKNPGSLRPIPGGPADSNSAEWTPEAVDLAAERYLVDGTLPPLGMGKSAVRGQIINLAAQKAGERGNNNQAAALNQVAAKANTQALAQNEKLYTATSGYANTLDKNLDNLLASYKKIDSSGSPLINKAVRSWQQGTTGDPQTADMIVWLNSVQGEFAKLRSGSLGNAPASDQAMRDSKEVINKYMNAGGIQAVAQAMRQEKDNRLSSIKAESDRLRGALSPSGPTATPQPAPKAPPPNANAKGWVLHQDAQGNLAYVSPDGKQFEQVQ